jgi:hypothetical protein
MAITKSKKSSAATKKIQPIIPVALKANSQLSLLVLDGSPIAS